jgi:hypothetical protein
MVNRPLTRYAKGTTRLLKRGHGLWKGTSTLKSMTKAAETARFEGASIHLRPQTRAMLQGMRLRSNLFNRLQCKKASVAAPAFTFVMLVPVGLAQSSSDYFVPPGVLCRIIFCPGALNELPGAVADVRLFSICCPGAELRLCTPVDLGAALASETLSASDTPAMIQAALYMMTVLSVPTD